MATRFAIPFFTAIDGNGDPISGAKLNFYEAGTSTRLDTFADEGLTIPNSNPVIADAAGRFSDIWLKEQDYKVVYMDAADVTLVTVDPINGLIVVSGDDFKVSPQVPPDMTVQVSAGTLFDIVTKVRISKAIQDSSVITAPTVNPRIDVIYVDMLTGVIGIATGAEAASPVPPTLPDAKLPIAQIALSTTTSEIIDSLITDIRELGLLGAGSTSYFNHNDSTLVLATEFYL